MNEVTKNKSEKLQNLSQQIIKKNIKNIWSYLLLHLDKC